MSLEDLLAAAVKKYGFRRQLRKETAAAYRAAFILHVEQHDFAMAHELRIGKAQADWTPEDAQGFKDHVTRLPRARQDFKPGETPDAYPTLASPPGSEPVTEENLLLLAQQAIDLFMSRRRKDPDKPLPILALVLLNDGRLLSAITERGDRVAVLKFLTRNTPAFGFALIFDMFLHLFKTGPGEPTNATRQECIGAHIGTRDLRIARLSPYRRTADGIVPDAPYDMDMRTTNAEDPYAEILVSVPPPSGRPS